MSLAWLPGLIRDYGRHAIIWLKRARRKLIRMFVAWASRLRYSQVSSRILWSNIFPCDPCCSKFSTSSASGENSLVRWVLNNGGSLTNVAVSNLGFGWGLKATEECQEGVKLVDLPSTCHLTYNNDTDIRLLALIEEVPDELWGAKLALKLLAERAEGTDSKYAAYINNLPQRFSGIPIFFGKEAIDSLQYPPLVQQVKKRGQWLHTFSTGPLRQVYRTPLDPFNGAAIDINALGWAMAAVTSRAFRTRGPQQPASMLPLIDMCNHSFQPNCEVLPTADGGVGLFAKTKIVAGEQLLISYGALSNDFLLLDYGFIVPSNPHDRVQLRFDVDLLETGLMVATAGSSPQSMLMLEITPWKTAMLEELGVVAAGANREVLLGGKPPIDPRLLAAARLVLVESREELGGRSVQSLSEWLQPLHRQNELLALRLLTGVCAVALSNFPTTLEQDLQLLARHREAVAQPRGSRDEAGPTPPPLAPDVEMAVCFRVERKRLLRDVLVQLADRMQAVLVDPAIPDWRRDSAGTT